jgi:ATP:cob(I)alamin adenosyltransferase
VDEASSALAIAHATLEFDDLKSIIREIQNSLFSVSAELASDETQRQKEGPRITEQDIGRLEGIITNYTEEFGKVTGFSLPGETQVSSTIHLARTIVRRAERHVVSLSRQGDVSPSLLKYLNRLSDTLYVLAKIEVYRNFIKQVVDKLKKLQIDRSSDMANEDTIFNMELCDILRNAALSESLSMGVPVSLSIADGGGNQVYFCRFPGALLVSVGIAQNKSYTAVAMKQPTGNLYEAALPGGSLHGINTADPRLVVFGGGFPLFIGGELVGGIGISGGSVQEDEQIGRRVVVEFEKHFLKGN